MSSVFNVKPNTRCVTVVDLLTIITCVRNNMRHVTKQGGKSPDLFMHFLKRKLNWTLLMSPCFSCVLRNWADAQIWML